jgi:cobalt-zinc-cadmium efflux system outer membrane protein
LIRVLMISALAVAAAISDASAQDPLAPATQAASPGLSTRQAVDEAVARNPAITAAREQVEQARARVTEATAFPDPTFVATLEQETSFLKPRTAQTQDYGLGLTLPFPDKFHLRGEAARGDLRAAESSLAKLRQQIAAQTVTAYDALLVALKHQEDLREGLTLSQDFLKRTEARFQAGTVPRFDVIKARVDVAQAQNDLIANGRAVAVARASLNRLLGRSQGSPLEATDALRPPGPPPAIDELARLAESSRPELQGLAALQKGAGYATTLAGQYWLPDFNIILARNFTYGFDPAFTSAITFSVPLLFWQHENGEVAEARHRELELASTYADTLAQVGLDVRMAYAAATTALEQALFIRDSLLPEAREAYRIVATSYSLGGISALELLDAKRTLLEAEGEYADALGAANDARSDLELAVGAPLPTALSGGNDAP